MGPFADDGAPLNSAVNSVPRSWSSGALEIRETALEGKHAVAATEIHPGDTLIVEPPLAGCLLPEFYGTHCHHCYARWGENCRLRSPEFNGHEPEDGDARRNPPCVVSALSTAPRPVVSPAISRHPRLFTDKLAGEKEKIDFINPSNADDVWRTEAPRYYASNV